MLKKYRAKLWIWHRRLGYGCVVFLMVVSVTGILLNHTKALQLSQRSVNFEWLLKAYGFTAPQVMSQYVGGVWVSYLEPQIYFNGKAVQPCHGVYVGAQALEPNPNMPARFALACGDDILLLTEDGQWVERWGASHGLPNPITALGACESNPNQLCFSTQQQSWQLNLEEGTWQASTTAVKPAPQQNLPREYLSALEQASLRLSWERVILDIHAGRVFGLGPWLLDAIALGIILLGFTGLLSALSRRWK